MLEDHLRLRREDRLEDDLARNYARDVIGLSLLGGHRGHDGIRRMAAELHEAVPNARYEYDEVCVEGEVGMLVWSARGRGVRVREAADSFVVHNGAIVVQTVHYHVHRDEG